MRRTAQHDLSTVTIFERRPNAHSNVDGMLPLIGMWIVWTSFIFIVFPVIDLAVSRWFAEGQVFILAEHPFLKGVRDISRKGQFYIVAAMLLLIGLCIFLPKRYRFCPLHKPLFVLLSFASGPVAVVEILKALIGRTRPRDLIEFGGTGDFTPIWQFSAACSRNCSFPSGEAAAAAAALSLLVFVPKRSRSLAALILTPCLILIAVNRVFFGAHFISDVMLGWLLTMVTTAWIWRWIEARSNVIDNFLTRGRSD